MKHKKMQVRQGDVLVEYVDKLPQHLVEIEVPAHEKGRVILAHGEVTGHSHEIETPALATLNEVRDAMRALAPRYALVIKKPTALIHQEHARIPLPPGKAIVTRQREYAPEAIRNVAD